MHKTLAQIGVGLTLLAVPARAETPADDPDRARAQALDRLRARLVVERTDAQEHGRRIAAASMWHHARAAHPE